MSNNTDLYNGYKKIFIVGLTGAGKSQTGNVLINWDANKLDKPFRVSDDADATTVSYEIQVNNEDKFIVMDTIGFGFYGDNREEVLENMRKGLRDPRINNEIDLVIFVLRGGTRIDQKSVSYIDDLLKFIFKDKLKSEAILLLTNVDGNWLNNNINNPNVLRLKKLFPEGKRYGLYLARVSERDNYLTQEGIIEQNQIAINSFKSYIKNLNYIRTDLSFIQSQDFAGLFLRDIFPVLRKYASSFSIYNLIMYLIPILVAVFLFYIINKKR